MSVEQLPPGKIRPASRDAKLVRYDEYIDTQIQSTRRMVKAVGVATVLLVMTTGVLGFLLAAAVVEHWLLPGGFSVAVRSLLFAALVGSSGYYAARRLWPLCVRSINPAYAAQTIEHDNPSLKNSLLNLLLFRERREEITDAVYETLEEQAAQRLTRVPVESAVDRTQLLRLGYALVIIVTAAALYKMFSPKDPLVTAERVLMPWADVVPASRVSITNVEPGTTMLARGEVLRVLADVRGIGEDDPVIVRYTTADGQAVDKPAPMKPSAAGLRYTGQIPAAGASGPVGVAQNLRYSVEAGDARSREFAVTVVAAPTIAVERIDYDYPDYTGFADHSVDGLGDIRALEGTQVTIHARANQPIEEATVDFEADGRRDIVFNVGDTDDVARTSFVLALRDDRQTPKYTSYVLRFTSTDGWPNRDPAKYPIDVLPDYAPEAALLAPAEKVRDVRMDETVIIEIEARDPDFALSEVRLRGEVAGRRVLDALLLAEEHTGRFVGRFLFTPREHSLKAGDVMRYWASARDNRAPQPNEAASDPHMLRVVSSDPKRPGQPPPDRIAQRDRQPQQPGDQQQEGDKQPGEGESAPGESASADGDQRQEGKSEPGESASADGESGKSGDPSGDGQTSAGDQGEQTGNSPQQPGGEAGTGENAKASGGNKGDNSQPTGAHGNASGDAKGVHGEHREDASRRPAVAGGGEHSNNAPREPSKGGQAESDEQPAPVSPEGDNDGEAFDRISNFLKRQGKLSEQGHSKKDESVSRDRAPSRSDGRRSAEEESARADGNQREDGKRDEKPTGSSTQKEDSSGEDPGAKTRPGDPKSKTNEPGEQGNESQSPGGQQTSSKGESGAGDQPEKGQGAPDSQPNMKPADKWQQTPSGNKQSDDKEPPAGGRGKRESDSQGDQGGDVTGGGEEGGGQKANREGTGSAGQNQSADEGAGESSEQGAGSNSPNAGQDAKSDNPTGQSGSGEQGKGSAQRDSQGEQEGGRQEEVSRDRAPSRSDGRRSAPDDGEQNPGDSAGGAPTAGAGRTPDGNMQPTKTDGAAPDADAANLEYARKHTDLVLETLAEQLKRKQLDERLLDELGWSAEDLERFIARWQQLKAAASDESPSADAAQRELDDALRSLGLRSGPLRQDDVTDDDVRDLRQGYRGAVPLEYQERLRAYNQGVSRARRDGE